MFKFFIAVVGAVALLGACGGNETTPPPEKMKVSDVALPDEYNEEIAQASYKKYCGSCHGAELQGAGAYPHSIAGLPKEEVYIAIVEGVGRMPANMVTGEEAENLSVWIGAQ